MKKEIQQKYEEFQHLDQHIKQLQQQATLIDAQLTELRRIDQSLDELKEIQLDTEMFVPIGSGIFMKAALKETKELLVNIGSNVIVKKEAEEAKTMLQNQIKELNEIFSYLEQELTQKITQAQSLSEELEREAS